MKKSTICWLIVAAALVLMGGVLFGSAALIGSTTASPDFEWAQLSADEYQENTYEFSDDFNRIHINTATANVQLVRTDETSCKVVCKESETVYHTVNVADGTLMIDVIDTREWYHRIGFFFMERSVTVYLPEREYQALTVETDTGNVAIPSGLTFDSLQIAADTGNVQSSASVNETLQIRTQTGNVNLSGAEADEIRLTTSTGNIRMESVTCRNQLLMDVSTGNMTMTNITCRSLHGESSTGNMRLTQVLVEETIKLESETGNLRLERCDALDLSMITDTGYVSATLLSPKKFSADSDTGRIILPSDGGEGRCHATTDTGDIRIEVIPSTTP